MFFGMCFKVESAVKDVHVETLKSIFCAWALLKGAGRAFTGPGPLDGVRLPGNRRLSGAIERRQLWRAPARASNLCP